MLLNTSAFAITPAIYKSLPYDALHDFAPITMAVSTPNVMVVHPSVPVKSIKELIALAKARAAKGEATVALQAPKYQGTARRGRP